jgi:hypothetical protein
MMSAPRLHFIGFRGEEYWSAVRVWGRPDFIHEYATWSVLGDCAPDDTVIYGPHAWRVPKKWRHTRLLPHDLTSTTRTD